MAKVVNGGRKTFARFKAIGTKLRAFVHQSFLNAQQKTSNNYDSTEIRCRQTKH